MIKANDKGSNRFNCVSTLNIMGTWIILSAVLICSISISTLPAPATNSIYDEETSNDGKADFVDEEDSDRESRFYLSFFSRIFEIFITATKENCFGFGGYRRGGYYGGGGTNVIIVNGTRVQSVRTASSFGTFGRGRVRVIKIG